MNMHSLKTSYAGQIFALAKPLDSVGKRTRNRIPKEERKTLVESFIKKYEPKSLPLSRILNFAFSITAFVIGVYFQASETKQWEFSFT